MILVLHGQWTLPCGPSAARIWSLTSGSGMLIRVNDGEGRTDTWASPLCWVGGRLYERFNLANDTGLMMTMLGVDILFLPLPSLVHVVMQFGS